MKNTFHTAICVCALLATNCLCAKSSAEMGINMYQSIQEIISTCKEQSLPFWEAILKDDMDERTVNKDDSIASMKKLWDAMLQADETYEKNLQSNSKLVGGDGNRMEEYGASHKSLGGDFMSAIIATALKTGESNACMKRIVAAPTAGSCGVLPAVLIPYYRREAVHNPLVDEKIIEALYVSAGIGQVFAARAYIAGAAGGCQAEVGAASAMAAGAMAHIQGGNDEQIANAMAMAMKNLLGLVCDPVAGLVEVPCVKRNVIGAVNAIAAADMAMAGIISKIPPDEVIDAMKEIGDNMPLSVKETSGGGLAATETAKQIKIRLEKEKN